MAARNPDSRKSISNETMIQLIPIAVIVIGVAIAMYFLWPHSPSPASQAPVKPPAIATTATVAANAEEPIAPSPVVELTVEQLLKEASTALREQRMLVPPGNSALDLYLQILAKEPNNQAAQNALRELFPFATGAVEQNINTGAFDEATRVINLLAKADPSNYTLTILRSKLEAKRKQAEREQQATAIAAASNASKPTATNNANNVANERNTAAPPTAVPSTPATATAIPENVSASAQAPPPVSKPVSSPVANPNQTSAPAQVNAADATPATAVPTPAPATPSTGETRDAEIVTTAQPDYPPDALRKRVQGWVEVEFTVTAVGQVSDAKVLNADPPRVFNTEVLRAVKRWTFKPKMENGQAVDTRLQRRIEFKL